MNTRLEEAIKILERTSGGRELSPDQHLLVENVLVGRTLTAWGIAHWERLRAKFLEER